MTRVGDALRHRALQLDLRGLRRIAITSGSVFGTMILNAGLGAAFWWLAARSFSQSSVGLAAAAISAMLLLGSLSLVGLGTLVVRELSLHRGREVHLVSTAAAVVIVAGAVLGGVFAVFGPRINPELAPISANPLMAAVFALGVMVTALGALVDSAMLGLLRSHLQLARNAVFAGGKLLLLLAVALVVARRDGLLIFDVWLAAAIGSLAVLATVGMRSRVDFRPRVDWTLIPRLRQSAISHQAMNLALTAPTLGMPVVVALVGTRAETATFYIAWQLTSLAFFAPLALAQTLYAVGARDPRRVGQQARITIALAFVAGIATLAGLWLLGGPLLGLFGPAYRGVAWVVPILALGVLPLVIKDHYQMIQRIRGDTGRPALLMLVAGGAELAAAASGLLLFGLIGLALGWIGTLVIEAAFFGWPLARMIRES